AAEHRAEEAAQVVAALGPVQAGAHQGTRTAGPPRRVTGETREPVPAGRREHEAVAYRDEPGGDERVKQGDPEGSGQVVVAGTGGGELAGGPHGTQRHGALGLADCGAEVFD